MAVVNRSQSARGDRVRAPKAPDSLGFSKSRYTNQMGPVIGPGGIFDGFLPADIGSTYRESFHPGQSLRPPPPPVPIGMYPGDWPDAPKSTQGRLFQMESPRFEGTTSYKERFGTQEELNKTVLSLARSKHLSREEHERRWKKWQERQLRARSRARGGSDAASSSRCSEAESSVSVMPAGLVRVKQFGEEPPDGISGFRPVTAPWATDLPDVLEMAA